MLSTDPSNDSQNHRWIAMNKRNVPRVMSMSCIAVHLRSRSLNIVSLSDMIEGSYHSRDLYTTGQLVDGLQQKRKPVFIKWKWNHVIFSRATILLFHPVYIFNIYMYSQDLALNNLQELIRHKIEPSSVP